LNNLKCWSKKNSKQFLSQIFFQIYFWPNILFGQQKIVGHEKMLLKKGLSKKCLVKKMFGQKMFGQKNV